MPSIFLLRHCAYDNPLSIMPGRLPVELSLEGKQHARRLGEYFATQSIVHIYTSAILRCTQTAHVIADNRIPITTDKRLLETFSAYQGYWGENTHVTGFHFYSHRAELGGESFRDLYTRMADFWNATIPHLKENIIICSHGDPIMALFAHIHHQSVPETLTPQDNLNGWLEYGQFHEIVVENDTCVETQPARTA